MDCADDATALIALLELDGNYYVKGFTCAKYSGKWYIASLYPLGIDELDEECRPIEDDEAFRDLLQSIY